MTQVNHQLSVRQKRKKAVRSKLSGTKKRPRLTVYRSNKHLCLQVINDQTAQVLASATDRGRSLKGSKTEKAVKVAQELAKALRTKKVKQLVFDRGAYKYHGRVKAVAETLREAGLDF